MQNPALPDIRVATVADAGNLAVIRAQCFDNAWNIDGFAEMLGQAGAICLIAPDIAYALARKISPEAELITIAVVPEFRRRGIAENLIHQLWHSLRADGIETLHLEVNHKSLPARELYAKMGFSEVGRRRDYYLDSLGERHDAILMRLQTPL